MKITFSFFLFWGIIMSVLGSQEPMNHTTEYAFKASNKFHIETSYLAKNKEVSLFSMNGSLIKSFKINEPNTIPIFTIDISDVNCGFLLLEIEILNQIIIKKIINQN